MAKRTPFLILLAVVLGLMAVTAALQFSRKTGDDTRVTYEIAIAAKIALVTSDLGEPFATQYEAPLLAAFERTEQSPNFADRARALRRKAIWCALRKRDCAAPALASLAAISPEQRAPAPADEADIFREILLTEAIEKERAQALKQRAAQIQLGFFDPLLMEVLCRNSSDPDGAALSHQKALQTAAAAIVSMVGFFMLLGVGGAVWLWVLVSSKRAKIIERFQQKFNEKSEEPNENAVRRLIVVATFFAVSIGASQVIGRIGKNFALSPQQGALITLLLETALLLVVLIAHYLISKRKGIKLGFQKISPWRAFRIGLFAYLLMWPVLLFIMLPLGALFERLGLPARPHPIVDQLQSASSSTVTLFLWIIVAAVLAPMLEEAIFRGALHSALSQRLGVKASLGIVALLFALIHPQIGLGLVGIFVVGLTLSLVRIYEGSLWPCVVLHALNNGVAVLLATFLVGG